MRIKKSKILNFVVIFLFIYLIFHTIYGNRGIIAYSKLEKEIEILSKEVDEILFNRIVLEKRVKDLKETDSVKEKRNVNLV